MPTHAELTELNRPIFNKIAQALFVDLDLDLLASYISDEQYIQHNPLLPDGKEAVLRFLKTIFDSGEAVGEVLHVLVDGDIGVVHANLKSSDGETRSTIVDMFRLQDGKLVEHWDVMQMRSTHDAMVQVAATSARSDG